MIKKQLKLFFSFSKKEFNGLLIFCVLLAFIIFLPEIYIVLFPPRQFDFKQFKQEIAAFKASAQKQHLYSYKQVKDEIEEKEMNPDYFEFDPNDLPAGDWKKLGLSDKQIKVIKNYEAKGGRFYKKEDLQKIYSISDADYARLEPYIVIPKKAFAHKLLKQSYPESASSVRKRIVVELNSADSAQLESLPGIGPAFASRIIKYRNRLGGFYMKEQLKEVYGLDSAKYEKLKDQILIDPSQINKININSATFDDLKKFPYLSYKQMNALIQYRKQHGNYKSAGDIKNIPIISEEILRKIAPYLNCND